jgi:chaperonin GroES
MNLLPLSNHIIVTPAPVPVTVGLIHLPESYREKPAEGIVIAVGPGKRNKNGNLVPIEVKKGDRVLCNRLSADPIQFEGKPYKVISADDVIAIL